MRGAFARKLSELADKDRRLCLLTGDLGFMALEPFSDKHPDRFFNMGAAEQNMVGVATGLAEAGFIPFVYSIVTFATLRPYEFIRNGAILNHLPVRIVGVGGGFEYGHNGATHYGLEDVGIMRIQPGMTVIAPADSRQTETALNATWDMEGPVYYRLGKNDKPIVPGLEGDFDLGRAQLVKDGKDLLFITMGAISCDVAHAIESLEKEGLSCAHLVVASINPPPVSDLIAQMRRFRTVLTVEAHYVSGGLGSLVCEVAAENNLDTRVIRNALRLSPDGLTGSQDYLHDKYGISNEKIIAKAREALAATAG